MRLAIRRRALWLVLAGLGVLGTHTCPAAEHGSLHFDGRGLVSLGDVFSLPAGTIEFWFRPATLANNHWLISKTRGAEDRFEFGFGTVGLMFMVRRAGEWSYVSVPREAISVDEWHHAACVFDLGQATLFLDGKSYPPSAGSAAFGLDHLAGGELLLGRGGSPGEYFRGLLGWLRLSDSARYANDFAPPATPPAPDANTVGLWRFAETEGETVADDTGRSPGRIAEPVGRSAARPVPLRPPAAARGVVPAVRTPQPPLVDGDLSDPAWERAAQAVDFVTPGQAGAHAPRQTAFRLLYGDRALYLAAECFEPGMAELLAAVREHDGPVWSDDCLELFLDPDQGGTSYRQVAVNALGVWYDARGLDPAWNAALTVGARRHADRWTLELALPYAELECSPPAAGSTWRFNVAREHRVGTGVALSTWATLAQGFHAPEDFASLRFAGEHLPNPSRRYRSQPLAVRNPTFAERGPDGRPIAWTLGPGAALKETAYLSGVYAVHSAAAGPVVQQDLGATSAAGCSFELLLRIEGGPGVTLDATLKVETDSGDALTLLPFQDQPLRGGREDLRARVTIPVEALCVGELTLSRGGDEGQALAVHEVALLDLSAFREVRELREVLAPHRQPFGEPFVSPAKPWAMPLAGGPLRTLCLVDHERARDAFELAERLALELDLVTLFQDTWYADDAARVNARLSGRGEPYEVILVAAPVRAERLARAIRDAAAAGAGVLCLQSHGSPPLVRGLSEALPAPVALSEAIPPPLRLSAWQRLPTVPPDGVFSGRAGAPALHSAAWRTLGRGRVAVLTCGGPMRGLLPVTGENPAELPHWPDYYWAALAQMLRSCAPRPEGPRIIAAVADEAGASLRLRLHAPTSFTGELTVEFRRQPELPGTHVTRLPVELAAERPHDLEVPVPQALHLLDGLLLADLILRDPDGATADWGVAEVPRRGTVTLAPEPPWPDAVFVDGLVPPGQITARNTSAQDWTGTLRLDLVDATDRCVWRETRPLSVPANGETTVGVAPGLERVLTVYHRLRATLADAGRLRDLRDWELRLPDRWAGVLEDFHAGVSADYFVRTATDDVWAAWLLELGFTVTGDGGLYQSAARHNLPSLLWNLCLGPFHFHAKRPVRDTCLSDPEVLRSIAESAVGTYVQARRCGAPMVSVGDECELARDGGFEVCFDPRTAEHFRRWLQSTYGTLDRLNAEWGSAYTAWEAIGPIAAEEARRQARAAQWVDFRLFMEEVWVSAFVALRQAVEARDAKARVGFTNPFVRNPFSGEDHARSAQVETALIKYFRPDLCKEYRSFNPAAPLMSFYGYLESEPFCRWAPWNLAFNGADIVIWWSGMRGLWGYELLDASGRLTPRAVATLGAVRDLQCGVGKLLHEARVAPNPVAILHSQASLHASWFESSMPVGQIPWAENGMERLPPENPFGLHYRSLSHWKWLLKESALQPDLIATPEVTAERLARYRMLILPCSNAVSDELLEALRAYAEAGGTVLADLRTGLNTAHGRPVAERPAFERLFGVRRVSPVYDPAEARLTGSETLALPAPEAEIDRAFGREALVPTAAKPLAEHADGTPAELVHALGAGRAVYLNFVPGHGPASVRLIEYLLEQAQVPRPVRLLAGDATAFGYECFLYEWGAARYLGILRDLPPQAPGDRGSWAMAAFRQARTPHESLRVVLAAPAEVYDVRAGEALGQTAEIRADFEPGQARLYALLPYRVTALEVDRLPETVAQGRTMTLPVRLATTSAATDHVVRIELTGPDGRLVTPHCTNAIARGGVLRHAIPLALNAAPGRWQVSVRDVASGVRAQGEFVVSGAR
jgi:hypothetical protein